MVGSLARVSRSNSRSKVVKVVLAASNMRTTPLGFFLFSKNVTETRTISSVTVFIPVSSATTASIATSHGTAAAQKRDTRVAPRPSRVRRLVDASHRDACPPSRPRAHRALLRPLEVAASSNYMRCAPFPFRRCWIRDCRRHRTCFVAVAEPSGRLRFRTIALTPPPAPPPIIAGGFAPTTTAL